MAENDRFCPECDVTLDLHDGTRHLRAGRGQGSDRGRPMTAPDVDRPAEEYAEQWPEDTGERLRYLGWSVSSSGRPHSDRDGDCTCDYNPGTTEGPEEDCPHHGRPYAYWIERGDALQARAEAAEARLAAVAALADEWEQDYPSALAACNREPDEWWIDLRAALAPDAAPSPGVEDDCEDGVFSAPVRVDLGRPAPPDEGAREALVARVAEALCRAAPLEHDPFDVPCASCRVAARTAPSPGGHEQGGQ